MTTTQIVWTVVIVVAVLALIGLLVASIRKKNAMANRDRAAQLRERADTGAAGLPDAEARADRAEADAERAHLEAQRADEHAVAARAEADQEHAIQEDRIRAADRLDPDVDNTADDYTPEVVTPAGPASDPSVVDPDTIFDRDDAAAGETTTPAATSPEPPSQAAGTSGGTSVTLEPVDAATHDASPGHDNSLARRLNGDDSTDGDDGTPIGGTHRA